MEKMAALGVGAWPDPKKVKYYLHGREKNQSVEVSKMQKLLSQYGYDRIPQSGELDEATQKLSAHFKCTSGHQNLTGNMTQKMRRLL